MRGGPAPEARSPSTAEALATPARLAALRPYFNRPVRCLAASAPQHWRSSRPIIGAAAARRPVSEDEGGAVLYGPLAGSQHGPGAGTLSSGEPFIVEDGNEAALRATLRAAASLRDSVASRAPEDAVKRLSGALEALSARVQPPGVPASDGCATAMRSDMKPPVQGAVLTPYKCFAGDVRRLPQAPCLRMF